MIYTVGPGLYRPVMINMHVLYLKKEKTACLSSKNQESSISNNLGNYLLIYYYYMNVQESTKTLAAETVFNLHLSTSAKSMSCFAFSFRLFPVQHQAQLMMVHC